MPLCPQNHLSDAADFCAVCGIEMRAPEPPAPAAAPEPCAICATPRETPQSVFCEVCGYNFATHTAPAAATPSGTDGAHTTYTAHGPSSSSSSHPAPRWEIEARVLPDADPDAPASAPARLFPLDLPNLLIGRRSPRRGIEPEIALDPDDGVSHRHARLRRLADGGFDLLDLGSANGTARNGVPLDPNVPVPLQPGDLIRLGRWTELLVRTL